MQKIENSVKTPPGGTGKGFAGIPGFVVGLPWLCAKLLFSEGGAGNGLFGNWCVVGELIIGPFWLLDPGDCDLFTGVVATVFVFDPPPLTCWSLLCKQCRQNPGRNLCGSKLEQEGPLLDILAEI